MSTRVDIVYDSKTTKTFDNGGEMFTIIDGKRKYKFYTTKKDGEETKAYEGWMKLNPKPHDILPAEVEEEEKSFKDEKTKKMVNYTERRILYFYTDQEKMTVANTGAPKREEEAEPAEEEAPSDELVQLRKMIANHEARILALEGKKKDVIEPSFPSEKKEPEIPTINTDDEKEIRIEDVPF